MDTVTDGLPPTPSLSICLHMHSLSSVAILLCEPFVICDFLVPTCPGTYSVRVRACVCVFTMLYKPVLVLRLWGERGSEGPLFM